MRVPILGFPGYEVTTEGRVFSRRKELKPIVKSDGYLCVSLYANNKPRLLNVHTLVLIAFRGPRPEGMQAAHGDGNRRNNALGNLRWATPRENTMDRIAHGTAGIGENHPRAKLTDEQVRSIRSDLAAGITGAALSRKFGVTATQIYDIKNRRVRTMEYPKRLRKAAADVPEHSALVVAIGGAGGC